MAILLNAKQLRALEELAREHDAIVYVTVAYATGFVGVNVHRGEKVTSVRLGPTGQVFQEAARVRP